MRRTYSACLSTLLALVVSGTAFAQDAGPKPARAKDTAAPNVAAAPAPVRATVVGIDGNELLLDLSAEQVAVGTRLTLYRTIVIKHPITGASLEDRFPNGEVEVAQVGKVLSIARPISDPSHAPAVGDVAEAGEPKEPPRKLAECQRCVEVVEVQRELLEVWRATIGKPPAERITALRAYATDHPDSKFRAWVDTEIAFFEQNKYGPGSDAVRTERARRAAGPLVEVTRVPRAERNARVDIGVYATPEARIRNVRLYVRASQSKGEYEGITLRMDERGQARATVPAQLVPEPGFDYFVEAELPGHESAGVLGTAKAPIHCKVTPPPGKPQRTDMSRVRLMSEYVSFNSDERNDYYYVFEGDYLLRLPVRVLEGVRLGYGHYRGEGNDVDELEAGVDPVPAAYTYGYLELAVAFHEMFALLPRVEVGLGRANDEKNSTRSDMAGGFQLRARIGRERGTHLVLAGATTPEIGSRAFVALAVNVIEKWPLGFEVHVTNQPVKEDLGVRLVGEVGYRATDTFSVAFRGSYQGRTIDHTGFGGGLALTFDW